MTRVDRLAVVAIVLASAVASVAVTPLSPSSRALVLAIVAAAVVAVAETLGRLAEQRRAPSRPKDRRRCISRRADAVVACGLAVVSGAFGWALTVAGSAIALGGWIVLAIGGIGAVVAVAVLVAGSASLR